MSEWRKRLGDAQLEAVRSTSVAASAVAIAWLALLAGAWIGQLEERKEQIRTLRVEQENLRVFEESSGRSNALAPRVLPDADPSRKEIDERLKEAKEAATVPFRVPGTDIELPMPTGYAPTFWLVLALGLVVQMYLYRARMLYLAANSARIYQSELGTGESDLRGQCHALPWWVAPLPSLAGRHISAETFRVFVGSMRNTALPMVSVLFLLLLAVEVRVVFLAHLFGVSLVKSGLQRELLFAISIASLASTVIVAMCWFAPSAVPDEDAPHTLPNLPLRRRVLGGAGAAIGLVVIGALASRSLGRRWHAREPRFVHTRKRAGAHPESARAGVPIERTAVQLISEGQPEKALDLLLAEIKRDLARKGAENPPRVPSFRLWDLMAGTAVRHGLNGYLAQLMDVGRGALSAYGRASDHHTQELLRSRLQKWSRADNAWRSSWAVPKDTRKWAGLLM